MTPPRNSRRIAATSKLSGGLPSLSSPESVSDALAGGATTATQEASGEFRETAFDPDLEDSIDEVTAVEMQRRAKDRVGEDGRTLSEIFDAMPPEKRKAMFAQIRIAQVKGTGLHSWDYIDPQAAPKNLSFYWFSATVVGHLGMRGYRRVKRTPQTVKWVPNAKQIGSSPFITHGNYTLVAISKDVALEREIMWSQSRNETIEKLADFDSALDTPQARKATGLTSEEAQELSRLTGGVFAQRGPDPDAKDGSPDWIS